MEKKIDKKMLFLGKFIRRCCNKLPLLRREYLLSALSGLTNSPKILYITQRNIFNLNCLDKDQ